MPPVNPLLALLDLSRKARQAASAAELRFLLVNDSHALASYRQSALWMPDVGVQALSGVVQPEANAPYTQWLDRICAHLAAVHAEPSLVSASDVPADVAQEWADWLPACALWLPTRGTASTAESVPTTVQGGLLLTRDLPWTPAEVAILAEWLDVWSHAWRGRVKPPVASWRLWRSRWARWWRRSPDTPWWRHRPVMVAVGLAVLLCFPVRLTVLAPGELVPAHPVVVRAPLDGVVDTFHVQPNQLVKKNQLLFGFDEALIQSKLDVAEQILATAETDYRQTSQQALQEAKYRNQLALLTGKIEEKRAEVNFLREQLQRARVLAPQDGVVLFDDPSEWIGRPVTVGERILRLADPTDVEIEVWLPLADAVALENGSGVTLYLNASPLSPVSAQLRYMAHDAVQRPDGNYAYRIRAALDSATPHRVGLKGTAKLHGGWVSLAYWVLRRPLASLRTLVGI